MQNAMEIMPFVYTPTVGEACETYHRLPIQTRGVYITADGGAPAGAALAARPKDLKIHAPGSSQTPDRSSDRSSGDGLKVAVVTDGERILGLGDLGAGGMAIAEGKILLYTVCAGVDPKQCLPVCLDVGTDNEALLEDPAYRGLRRRRLRGNAYDALVEEFMAEMRSWQPRCLCSSRISGTKTRSACWRSREATLLQRRHQGTACVALAGLLSASRLPDVPGLGDQTFLFYGAGEAAGIGELVAMCLEKRFADDEEAIPVLLHGQQRAGHGGAPRPRRLCQADAQDPLRGHGVEPKRTLLEAIETLKPTALIGVSRSRARSTRPCCERWRSSTNGR